MQINIQGVGYFDGGTSLSCQVITDNVRGHLDVIISNEEYKEAVINDTLVDVAMKYISDMTGEAATVQQKKIDEAYAEIDKLKTENTILKQQMDMSNLSTLMMINELEKKIPKLEESPEVEEKPTEETNEDNNIIDN